MFDKKIATDALVREFGSLMAIVVVAALLQRLTHHLLNGTH